MARVGAECGKLDILVNAAGIEIEKTIEQTSLADWNRIFAINVTGTFLASKYALPLLRKSGGGSIINFGSYDGFIADPGLAGLLRDQGAVRRPDPRDGLRPRPGRHPRQRHLPRLCRYAHAEELLPRLSAISQRWKLPCAGCIPCAATERRTTSPTS